MNKIESPITSNVVAADRGYSPPVQKTTPEVEHQILPPTTVDASTHTEAASRELRTSKYPTQIVKLPSRGIPYQSDNPLSLGYVELKYMTAKEEDILTTESYIRSGVVLDKLFKSLIVTKIDYDTMLVGDKDAIMMAARAYGYGEEYNSKVTSPSGKVMDVSINLLELKHKEFDESKYTKGLNSFEWVVEDTKDVIRFHLLTNGDQKIIDDILRKQKTFDGIDRQSSSRINQMIDSVNGNTDRTFIKLYVENDFRSVQLTKFRKFIASLQPGIDMELELEDGDTGLPFRTQATIGLDFLWPNA